MHINDVKRFISGIISKQVPVTVAIMGPSGIGKSALEKQLSKEHGIGFIDLRLASQEPGDLIGTPYREGDRTKWAKPIWFPEPGTKGILCLEEINRAPTDVRQCVFQLIWDRVLHTHVLPEGWTIVLAMNPENGEYQVEPLDKAMVRRCVAIAVEPNVDVWLDWAMKDGGVPRDITGFIGTHRDMLFHPETFEFPVKRTPAGWGDTLSLLWKAKAIPQDLEFEIISGVIGQEAAASFRKYLDANYERPVAGELVLKDYETVKAKVLKQRTKADEMSVTLKELIRAVEEAKKLNKKQLENLTNFMLDLTADFQALLAQKLPAEIISILGEDDRWSDTVGRSMKESREDK